MATRMREVNLADEALLSFSEARQAADAAWEEAVSGEGSAQPDLNNLQARALIAGLEATSLLLQDLRNSLPASTPAPEQTQSISTNGHARKRLLTSSEAAKVAGVSLATIRRYGDRGLIPVVRTLGGQRRFDPADLQNIVP